MEKTNEILTIAGERVEVRYENDYYEACGKCCFHNIFVTCNVRTLCHGCPCDKYSDDKNRRFAYFVRAEESANKPQTDANKNEHTREQKADFLQTNDADKAAENSEIIFSIDGELTTYSFVGAPRWWATIREAEEALSVFKAGAEWQRERLMKDAVEIAVSNVGILQMGSILTDKGIFAGDTIQAIIIKKEK